MPKLIMQKLPIWLALLLVLTFAVYPKMIVMARNATRSESQGSANDLIAEVNALRVANGLPVYVANSMLMQVAQDQANYMASTGQIAHRPGLTQRLLNTGYPLAGDLSQGGFRAENITGGNKTAAQAVLEWTGDALHLNTMLSPNLSEIGSGVVKVGDRNYLVIICARPTTSGQPQIYTPNLNDPDVENSSPSDFIVPIVASTPDESGMVYHEVQYGQTLWAIAIEYGVKIDEIRALNNLGTTTEIYQGDRLLIRKEAPPSPAAATLEAVPTPVVQDVVAVQTNFSTSTPVFTVTPTLVIVNSSNGSLAGVAIGVVLVALLMAGMLTWMGSRRLLE